MYEIVYASFARERRLGESRRARRPFARDAPDTTASAAKHFARKCMYEIVYAFLLVSPLLMRRAGIEDPSQIITVVVTSAATKFGSAPEAAPLPAPRSRGTRRLAGYGGASRSSFRARAAASTVIRPSAAMLAATSSTSSPSAPAAMATERAWSDM